MESDPHVNAHDTGRPLLWLARHAQPVAASGLCYGALDLSADANATRDAAQALAAVLPKGLQVLTSPLQRCELLAQELSGLRPDLTYKTETRLAEMNFGCFEGQRWDQIDKAALDAWTADFWQHRFGGRESVAMLMQRVADVWDAARSTDQAQVWITHAGVIRAATLLARGVRRLDDAQLWPQTAPAFGQWMTVARPASRATR